MSPHVRGASTLTRREDEEPEALGVLLPLQGEWGGQSPSGPSQPVAAGAQISFSTIEADLTAYAHHVTTGRRPRRNTQLQPISHVPL